MVIDNLNIECVTVNEAKYDPPLVIDGYGILPFSLAFQGMQAIAWRDSQIIHVDCQMNIFKAPDSPSNHFRR